MIKVDIISGFLGAGKTTLIKKLISEALKGEKLVIIENEFGDIGIDGGFLQEAGIEITEMNSGCICCTLVGDFSKALAKVAEEYQPQRIIIEPSGVGKLSDVISAVNNAGVEELELNSYSTVADVKKCKMYMKNFGEFFNNQIESAGTIVLSHTKGVALTKIEETVNLLREHNKEAEIITTDWDLLTGQQIMEAIEHVPMIEEVCPHCGHHHDHHDHDHHDHDHDHCHCHDHDHHHDHDHDHCHCHDHDHDHHHDHCHCHDHDHHHDHDHDHDHHHHHADEVFTSWGKETLRIYSESQIQDILNKLDSHQFGTILRAKGILQGQDGWIHFDYIPGEQDVRKGAAGTIGKFCVIGADLDIDKLTQLFMPEESK